MLETSLTIKEKRDLFMGAYERQREAVDARIADGIEKNRKGFCQIRFTDRDGNPIVGKKVRLTQKSHDFKYGANIFLLDEFESEADNAEYRRIFKEYFNLATVPFYWNTLEPEEGKPRYAANSVKIYRRPAPDLCLQYCEENGLSAKLHCLVYEHFLPEWLKKLPADQIRAKYEERFRQIAERYSGRMVEFEVINELLSFWNESAISHDKDILEWSFDLARRYFPDETLVINDGNPFQRLAREDYRHPLYMMIEKALLKGVSIDKIGMQNHQFTGATSKNGEQYDNSIRQNASMCDPMPYFKGLDVMSELGLPLELTEVTVSTLGDTEEDEQLQADVLKLWYSIWFSHPAVDTVVYWNTVDGYAYDDGVNWNENHCRGGLFHHDLTPKKAAITLKKLFCEEWHTDVELTTNENGYIDFRGFYGDYSGDIDGAEFEIGIHKNESNRFDVGI